jgi:glycerophosphoryl diester phosphodiesterase
MIELIAHRGACFEAPENSLQAFQIAMDQGAARIEFDVQLTRDGVPVVYHDATTERLTGRRLEIEFSTLAEIRDLRLSNGEPIPTLDEACELFAGKVEIDLEIKTSVPSAVSAIVQVLGRHRTGSDPFITSFDPTVLLGVHLAGFKGRRGLLIGSKSMNVRQRYYEAWPVSGLVSSRATDLVIHHMLAHRALRRELSRRGLGVYLWTALEDEQKPAQQRLALYQKLVQMQPAGIIVARVGECLLAGGRELQGRR